MKNKLIFVLVFVIAVVALEAMVLTKKSEAKIYSSDIWNKDLKVFNLLQDLNRIDKTWTPD